MFFYYEFKFKNNLKVSGNVECNFAGYSNLFPLT